MIVRARIGRLVLQRGSGMDQVDVRRVVASELDGLARTEALTAASIRQHLSAALTHARRQPERR